ncbi:MAG: ABC transporter permease [Anaerolineales bacterium]|jgi:peptide/nickel transport system permease protein|nr:ABC transporter permease [Anaerolineales bacterium]HUV26293.1 ABC transporter permease [Anaerolineales bacterium]
MAKFILQRLLIIPLLLLLVNFLGYTYAHYARPIRAARTPYVQVEEAGPLFPEYINYLQTLINLDFGMEIATPDNARVNESVTLGGTLAKATLASLGLLAISLTISVILGLSLGFKATKNDPPDVARWLTISSTVGLAMPSFYIGSLLIIGLIFYIIWRGPDAEMLLPLSGYGWDAHLILPVIALMARPTFQLAQVTAGVLSAELGKQYVIAGRSMGRTWRSIRLHFALKNVVAPVILTIAGLQRFLVGELIMIEWLFRWPGLGRLLGWTLVPAQMTSTRGSPLFLNPPVMATVLTLIAALFLITDFLAAIAVRYLDPRVEGQETEIHKT